MVTLGSMSVATVDEESTISSCSLVSEGGRDAVRDDAVLWSCDMRCDSCVLGVMI